MTGGNERRISPPVRRAGPRKPGEHDAGSSPDTSHGRPSAEENLSAGAPEDLDRSLTPDLFESVTPDDPAAAGGSGETASGDAPRGEGSPEHARDPEADRGQASAGSQPVRPAEGPAAEDAVEEAKPTDEADAQADAGSDLRASSAPGEGDHAASALDAGPPSNTVPVPEADETTRHAAHDRSSEEDPDEPAEGDSGDDTREVGAGPESTLAPLPASLGAGVAVAAAAGSGAASRADGTLADGEPGTDTPGPRFSAGAPREGASPGAGPISALWHRLGDRARRLVRWVAVAVVLLVVAATGSVAMIGSLSHDPARWHVDPIGAQRTGKPNDYLVLPSGMNTAAASRVMAPVPVSAFELMERFDAIAMASPRVERVAGTPQDLLVTYVQRSALFGFPDYISVSALESEEGAALAIWSRARIGHSDLGVNEARIEAWLSRL